MSKNGTDQSILLQARNLVKEFHTGEQTIRVLDDIQIDIHTHDYVSVRGPSGVGKTTLLHVLSLIDTPTRGEIRVEGDDVTPLSDRERSLLRNRKFGFVFQFYHLISELSALQNVLLPTMISSSLFSWFGSRSTFRDRGRRLLKQVGLENRESHPPSKLSGGERQRVAIARALIMQPDLLFCDEPTGNLDQKTGQQVYEVLEKLREEHQTALVLATHDEQLSQRANRQLVVREGQLETLKQE